MAVSRKQIRKSEIQRFEQLEQRNKFKKQVLVGNWEATTETTKEKEGQSCRVTVEQSENSLKMERGKALN
jgi:hypothetical protein